MNTGSYQKSNHFQSKSWLFSANTENKFDILINLEYSITCSLSMESILSKLTSFAKCIRMLETSIFKVKSSEIRKGCRNVSVLQFERFLTVLQK